MITSDIAKYQRGWSSGRPETECGSGSKVDQTEIQREWIPRMVEKYQIHSISDVGAGDLNWIPLVEWPYPIHYRAFDLVPRHVGVIQFDLVQQVPEPDTLILCLWVLNHLPDDSARQALGNLLASGSKYLMYTWFPAMADFLDLGSIESVVIRDQRELRLIQI